MYGFCLRSLRSPEEAEDAAQTTFVHAWRALRRGTTPAVEGAWLLAIARNVCRSASAGRGRAVEVVCDPCVLEEAQAAPAEDGAALSLRDALAGLTEQQRRALVLREWRGLSYGEIAARLGLSEAAVATLLFRARRSCACALEAA